MKRRILWPVKTAETSVLVRLGRAIHYLAVGAAVLTAGFIVSASLAFGFNGEPIALVGMAFALLAIAMLVRGCRYVLANE